MDRRYSELAQFGPLLMFKDVADVLCLSPGRVRGLLAPLRMNARLLGVCATTCSRTTTRTPATLTLRGVDD